MAEKLDLSQNRLLQLQELVGSRDESIRKLEEKLHETEADQERLKQEAQCQADELTTQIKMLQEQLLQVRLPCLFSTFLITVFCKLLSC